MTWTSVTSRTSTPGALAREGLASGRLDGRRLPAAVGGASGGERLVGLGHARLEVALVAPLPAPDEHDSRRRQDDDEQTNTPIAIASQVGMVGDASRRAD